MRRAGRAAAVAALLALAAPAAESAAPPAAGGVRLVEAAETAPDTVVGEVHGVRSLDAHGFTAKLVVESALRGGLAAGAAVGIAWEELAPSRAPRFAEGDRVLVSLEPLPGASIWLTRFPDPAERARVRAVAMRGDAFLRDPALASLDLFYHYLALALEARDGAAGAAALADLAASAQRPLALDAVRRLALRSDLAAQLGPDDAALLVRALLRPDAAPDLEDAVISAIGQRQLAAARPALEALAAGDPPPPAGVFAALAQLDSGLSPERTARLLAQSPPRYRAVAARWARGAGSEARLAALLRADPAPEVRAAAAQRLVELSGEAAIEPLLLALGDSDANVRGAALRSLATLGDPAVAPLRRVVDAGDEQAARSAVAALALSGSPAARAALVEIAAGSSDASLRALANIALGRPIGEKD